jgi:hypothetical protein
VLGAHAIAIVTLADGRVVRASHGHPLPNGATLGDLAPGDTIDDSPILSIRSEPYSGGHTWDLRPAGPTGTYFVGDVALGTTLAPWSASMPPLSPQ